MNYSGLLNESSTGGSIPSAEPPPVAKFTNFSVKFLLPCCPHFFICEPDVKRLSDEWYSCEGSTTKRIKVNAAYAVWPDFGYFWKTMAIIFLAKSAQLFGDFWVILKHVVF